MSRFKIIATSKKLAIILSYVSLAIHTISNLILTPLYLSYLGMEQYGLYQMIYTIASYILILDFGINTTMVRYISKFHATNDYVSERNFSAHCLFIVLIIIFFIFTTGSIINTFLLKIYPTISTEEANTAHHLFLIMLLVIAGTIIERFATGCLAAYEHFPTINCVSAVKLLFKILLTISFLYLGMGIISIAVIDLILISGSILFFTFYSIKELSFKIKFSKFDIYLIIEIFSFILPVFLQNLVGYINNYVDKTLLGILTSKVDVAIYSVAMTFITLFNALPSAISGVFLPQATKLVYGGHCNSQSLTNFVIRPGRYQFMMCGCFICGFVLFGREFISLWAGTQSIQAWEIALIIMIPNTIPLIQNTSVSILDALKKRLFRSIVLFITSLLNVFLSIFLISRYGMLGAPIGTALAFIIGYCFIMNYYYQKAINLQVLKMFKFIFHKTWICLIPAAIVGYISNMLIENFAWISLLIKVVIFMLIYCVFLYTYGMNEIEKNDISLVVLKLIKYFHSFHLIK